MNQSTIDARIRLRQETALPTPTTLRLTSIWRSLSRRTVLTML
jgi:hypothetical protein